MAATRTKARWDPPWGRWSNEQLLDARLCDLNLRIRGSVLETRLRKIREELRRREILVSPYFWLSDDWFTPEGFTGTAIPFFLAHPRLMRLERTLMGEVEGGTFRWCMKLLRHEAGHVVDHAFRLHKRRRWQQLFGLSSHRYPRFYRPNPYSKRHVQHLEYWYAQSHPDEDFAETFAVWLQPRSGWKKRYLGWPAMKKLLYVDALMGEIRGRKPPVVTRSRVDELPSLRKTLDEHYERKISGFEGEYPDFFDRDLLRLFTNVKAKGRPAAAAAIRRLRKEIVHAVSPWTGNNPYFLDHVIKDMMGRCRELKLFVEGPEDRMKWNLIVLVTKHVVNSQYRNRRWVEM
ncbi:MAG: putative zinc-binding metallopeptidase [Planctomycetota bacterium]|jgi:hypothetical protein